ncbi:MAG: ribonuclease, partial [Oscillospiraceae bacterium]
SPDSPVQAESPSPELPAEPSPEPSPSPTVAEDGWYSSKEDVALYVHLYGHLPDNYVTKREAQDLGWTGGSVERCAGEGTAIGGSRFGNYEGLLPEADGRVYTECDIGTVGRSSRGGQRLVFSNDGLIYYTGDHYESFELLYGEP